MSCIKKRTILLVMFNILLLSISGHTAENIYTIPSVTIDNHFNILVIWGTGDKTDPLSKTGKDRIMTVKDKDRTSTYTLSDLQDISNSVYDNLPDGHGWYINFPDAGEKVLGDTVVSDKKIYVTTYIPATGIDYCNKSGVSKIYALNYLSGAGSFSDGSRSKKAGDGISSSTNVSANPDTGKNDVFISLSEELNNSKVHTKRLTDPIATSGTSGKNLIYWRDLRIK